MVYLGIDVHRKRSHVVALRADGEMILSRRVRSRPEDMLRIFGELGPEPLEVVFEATFGWGWLADLLAEAGIPAHMAHPLATKAISASRVKNDAVDAKTLAHLLRGNLLTEAWIAPPAAREARRLARMRASLMRLGSRLKCQVHAILADHGVTLELSDSFGARGRRQLELLDLSAVSQRRVEASLRLIDGIKAEVALADRELKGMWAGDPRVERLLPIPGIGFISAAIVVSEIWDVHRFPAARQLACWAGLTPREHSSAERTRHGHISKQGSRWLRWILVEAATQHALRDPKLRDLFLRVQRGKPERNRIARVAVAHRLLTLCFYALRDEGGCRAYPVSS
jgi:transposase